MNIFQLLLDTYFGDNDSILVLGDFCEENNIYFQGLINTDVEESLYLNHYDYYGYNYDDDGDGDDYGYGNGDGDGNGGSGEDDYINVFGTKEFYL